MTEPLILKVRTTASAPQVHSALTEEKSLTTWLAEYATVDLPERYEFWGPSVPEGDAPHQQLVTADATSLAFTWLLDGEETSTEIAIAVENDETIITLTQSHFDFNDVITGASIRGVLQTFWALALANLVDSLEGRTITARGDFTSSNLSATVEIDAAVDAVYDSLISTEKVSEWFGYPIEIEPHVDGRFALGGIENNPHPAIIVDLVPNERVSVDWGPGGIGTWELEGSEGRTRLTLVSSGFDTNNPPYAGWLGNLAGLAELRRYHEITDWKSITVAA
ncbi:SRPBCC domain-containing protein [Rhodococcus sp. NPDC127530]|uniref:SRPBCC family protein n=1 Tax=unclassified Rhodococcus (in: high G+C Gram-positive bacteria) TaxID=192944 RepID=UPI003625910C